MDHFHIFMAHHGPSLQVQLALSWLSKVQLRGQGGTVQRKLRQERHGGCEAGLLTPTACNSCKNMWKIHGKFMENYGKLWKINEKSWVDLWISISLSSYDSGLFTDLGFPWPCFHDTVRGSIDWQAGSFFLCSTPFEGIPASFRFSS